jgi:hypothetical protein
VNFITPLALLEEGISSPSKNLIPCLYPLFSNRSVPVFTPGLSLNSLIVWILGVTKKSLSSIFSFDLICFGTVGFLLFFKEVLFIALLLFLILCILCKSENISVLDWCEFTLFLNVNLF